MHVLNFGGGSHHWLKKRRLAAVLKAGERELQAGLIQKVAACFATTNVHIQQLMQAQSLQVRNNSTYAEYVCLYEIGLTFSQTSIDITITWLLQKHFRGFSNQHSKNRNSAAKMISDDELYRLAIFLGSAAMLLIILYHFLEINAVEEPADVKGKTTKSTQPESKSGSIGR